MIIHSLLHENDMFRQEAGMVMLAPQIWGSIETHWRDHPRVG